jgi:hypothetical protein
MASKLLTALLAAICLLKAAVVRSSDSVGGGLRRDVETVEAFFVDISKASISVLMGVLTTGILSIGFTLGCGGFGTICNSAGKFKNYIILLMPE